MGVHPEQIHSHIIDSMKALGYPDHSGGICYGLSHMGMVSALQGKVLQYNERLDFLAKISSAEIKQRMEQAESTPQGDRSQEQKDLLQLKPFFDSVEMTFKAGEYTRYFEPHNAPRGQDFMRAMEVVSPTSFDENPIVEGEKVIGSYNRDSLKKSFTALNDELGRWSKRPLGIAMDSLNHNISITRDARNKRWLFNNAGKAEVVKFGQEGKLADKVINAFNPKGGDVAIFESKTYMREEDSHKLSPRLNNWKAKTTKKNIHLNKEFGLSRDSHNSHLLFLAVKTQDRELVDRVLANKETDPNMVDRENKNSPLHYAAVKGSNEVAQKLLESGADINKQNEKGYTPLHLAVVENNTEMVKELLNHNPDLNLKENSINGFTALDFAGGEIAVLINNKQANADEIQNEKLDSNQYLPEVEPSNQPDSKKTTILQMKSPQEYLEAKQQKTMQQEVSVLNQLEMQFGPSSNEACKDRLFKQSELMNANPEVFEKLKQDASQALLENPSAASSSNMPYKQKLYGVILNAKSMDDLNSQLKDFDVKPNLTAQDSPQTKKTSPPCQQEEETRQAISV